MTPLGWTLLAIACALLIGLCIFFAFEEFERGVVMEETRRTWSRWENLALGAIVAGVLIRLWFLYALGVSP